jgi:hypothetical protein
MPAGLTIKVNDEVLEGMADAAFENVIDAAEHLRARIRKNISTPGPPHSVPGSYPHLITGNLQASVSVYPNRRQRTVQVIAEADYAGHVEKIRPFMERTFNEELGTMKSICESEISAGAFHE